MCFAADFDFNLNVETSGARDYWFRSIDGSTRNSFKFETVNEPSQGNEHIRDGGVVANIDISSYIANPDQ